MHIKGVDDVCYADWFGGVYIDKKQFFARMAISDNFFDVYPEYIVHGDQLSTYLKERNACIVGSELVTRYHLKIGDIMPIDGDIYPGRWEFVIRGIYTPGDKATDPSNMLFHWTYIDEKMREDWPVRAGYVGWYVIKIHDPRQSA